MRRIAAAFALWLCAAIPALAQHPENLPVVGILRMNAADNVEPSATGIKDALAAVGLVDGRNIRLEVRLAEGHAERLPSLAQSLVRAKASVILAFGPPAIRAAQQATSTIPIVANADLLASGLIGSLAKPGGNTTGVSMLSSELDAKRLEILKEIMPSGRRFALLGGGGGSTTEVPAQVQAIADVAHALDLELQTVDIRLPTDLTPAFASLRASGAEAINVLSSPILFGAREALGRLSLTYKLPAICEWRVMAEAGCVASYGYRQSEGWAMLAALTDKMLKGAPPGETPAQQPTRFELVINLNTAKALGLTIPPAILGRADEIIE
jgi:putative tryptophan/tyrosine transport system substrate-binding protein